MRIVLLLAFALTLSAVAAPVPKALKKPSLNGLWVSESMNGTPHTGWSVRIDGPTMTMNHGWLPPDAKEAAPFTRDDAHTPPHLDVTWKGENQPQLYIYQLDGDTLALRHGHMQAVRPTKLSGEGGGGCWFVFKRVPDDYKFPPPPKSDDDE